MNDLFSSQGTLFDQAPDISPEQIEKRVRARLNERLALVRSADKMPWNRQREEVLETIFHQSSNWLPKAEREALCAAFDREMARLRADRR